MEPEPEEEQVITEGLGQDTQITQGYGGVTNAGTHPDFSGPVRVVLLSSGANSTQIIHDGKTDIRLE